MVDQQAKKITLVLGGGGARALTQIGVLKVLAEENIPIDRIVGVSAGAMIGAIYAANPDPLHLEKIILDAKQAEIMSMTLFQIRQGFVTGESLRQFIAEQTMHRSFEELSLPFVAVAVDLATGELVVLDHGDLSLAVNASCALPPVFHPVNVDGRLLVDGGAVNPVPVKIAERYPHDKIIAVNVAQQLPEKMPTNAISIFLRYHKIRLLSQSLFASENADVVIHPQVADTRIFDGRNREALIAEGERAARAVLSQIQA